MSQAGWDWLRIFTYSYVLLQTTQSAIGEIISFN